MTQTGNAASSPYYLSLGKRMLVGWVIGLVVISFFLISANEPNPWGKYWMIRPLIITPLAGAMGGMCNYILLRFHSLVRISKTLAMILSTIIFIVGLWLGIVLGLVGTMWN
jgi:hypothetical protein